MSGSFLANADCPAFQSFRKGANPGGVKIEVGHSYPLIAKNAANATHYRIRIDGAAPPERWVSLSCGSVKENTNIAQGSEAVVTLQVKSNRSLSYHSGGNPASVRVTTTSQSAQVKRQTASTRTTSYYMAFGRNLADENTAT
jgi:hypothetical protein